MNSDHSWSVRVGGVSMDMSMSLCSKLSRKSLHTCKALSMILGLTNDMAGLLQGFLDAVERQALSEGD